jgi:hypothetical protein
MRTPACPIQRKYFAVTLLLVTALLLAQWSGLAHRVKHAPQSVTQSATPPSEGKEAPDGSLRHSCVAFDAATVADLLVIASPAVRAFAAVESWRRLATFISREPPLLCHFSSRAPPLV